MKHLIVPEPVHIVDRAGKPVSGKLTADSEYGELVVDLLSFYDVISEHPSMVKGGADAIRRVLALRELIAENPTPGTIIPIREEDYRPVDFAIKSFDFSPGFSRYVPQLLPIVEAWENADKQDSSWKKKYDAEQAKKKAESENKAAPEFKSVG